MAIAAIEHIDVDEKGVARIKGSRSKVIQIVMDTMNGMGPQEIHAAYPHLSLAQIHAALAYYYEHQVEIDAQIMSDWQEVNELAAQQPESPLRQRLKQIKRERERSLVL